ncbi:hypothetical protein K7X08_004167 [Anisodus acutangulus]|uniref:Uncharacterized protein n=1 Tax=Anisodus acutangulus TaxID=402998 RepID=A0A9Q1MKL2_9SOLA|nr:hypothetical protein K7X08_004167 [Anisodus acutangulus]
MCGARKRYEIVNGVVEVKGVDLAPVDHGDEKGVPNFWLTVLKSIAEYEEEIYMSERDEEALKFLKKSKCDVIFSASIHSLSIRDKIIPDAALWFTGEAEEDDSIYIWNLIWKLKRRLA